MASERIDYEMLALEIGGDVATSKAIRTLGAERDAAEVLLHRALQDEDNSYAWCPEAVALLARAGLLDAKEEK